MLYKIILKNVINFVMASQVFCKFMHSRIYSIFGDLASPLFVLYNLMQCLQFQSNGILHLSSSISSIPIIHIAKHSYNLYQGQREGHLTPINNVSSRCRGFLDTSSRCMVPPHLKSHCKVLSHKKGSCLVVFAFILTSWSTNV